MNVGYTRLRSSYRSRSGIYRHLQILWLTCLQQVYAFLLKILPSPTRTSDPTPVASGYRTNFSL